MLSSKLSQASAGRAVIQRSRAARFLSTATVETGPTARRVISRRVWKNHEKTLPKAPRPKLERPEDKPWPRNVQIAGYVAAGVLIPYTAIWLITSNSLLREYFGPYLPMDNLRTHFGDLEWDAQSFADQEDEDIEDGYYQYLKEDSFTERKQQSNVDDLDQTTITATICLMGDAQVQESRQVPASTKANAATLAELIGASGSPKVAVDFEQDSNAHIETMDIGNMDTSSLLDSDPGLNAPTRGLQKETGTYSMWYYHRTASQQQNQDFGRTSDVEIERMRLEYTIEELGRLLKDPTCTRDIDEMRNELKQAKRDLSRLTWKRRFGI